MFGPKKLTVLLLLYCTLMLISVWPTAATRIVFGAATYASNFVLYNLTLLPGHKLFYRPYDELDKIRHECVKVRWWKSAQITERSSLGLGCQPDYTFRWLADPYEAMLYRVFDEALQLRGHSVKRFGAKAQSGLQYAKPTELAVIGALGDYFCHNEKFNSLNAEQVTYSLSQTLVNYATGFPSDRLALAARFDCQSHKIIRYEQHPHVQEDFKREFDL